MPVKTMINFNQCRFDLVNVYLLEAVMMDASVFYFTECSFNFKNMVLFHHFRLCDIPGTVWLKLLTSLVFTFWLIWLCHNEPIQS